VKKEPSNPSEIYEAARKKVHQGLVSFSYDWIGPIATSIYVAAAATTLLLNLSLPTLFIILLSAIFFHIATVIYAWKQADYQIDHAPTDLTDWQIFGLKEKNVIMPFSVEQIEPNSYDVLLGSKYTKILADGTIEEFDAVETILKPGEFLLAHTIETFDFPINLKGILQGKSSWARLSVFVEAAGLFDAGFKGTAVLELFNCGKHSVKLRKGEKIAQMSFHRSLPTALPYGTERGSHYQGQTGAKSSWLGKADRIVPNETKP